MKLIIISRPYLKMEEKLSTQSVLFFTITGQLFEWVYEFENF